MVEFDIRAFFDSVPHDLVVRAVEGLCLPAWVLICVRRWLTAPVVMPGGVARPRDAWMDREFPDCPFERYADDGLIRCKSQAPARQALATLEQRMREVGLELHPDKTRIIYCKDSSRRKPRDGPVSFHLGQLAGLVGPVIRGWIAYYGRYRRSGLHPLLARINYHVQEWIRRKYRRLRPLRAMTRAWNRITAQMPGLLPHWRWETGAWY